ncbi:hypothetical protein EOT10_37430 [Streptomyces antnestii]|uniref:Uncharacterized protein n=1 Tax=Streptomyces antnestii TaxID=2494256 RepID=A0A3S2V7Y6_9ACTN|nr:hypothetical protein [Streptomyces sp. San01]RVU16068.1 hypothetical protein EOT10_37430 [Streptomyces sp. San01]
MPEIPSAPEGTTLTSPAPSRLSRPVALRVIGVWLAVLALLAGFGVASASAGETARPGTNVSLAGVWDLTVTIHTPDGGTSVVNARFTFTPDHQLSAPGPLDENGQPMYTERGFWNARSDGTISFYIAHPGVPVGGAVPGDVQAVHLGRISGKSFSTVAYAFVTDKPGGVPQGPISVDTTADWVSPVPSS